MKKYKVSTIKAEELDVNGYIWPKEVLEKTVEKMNRKPFLIQLDYTSDGTVHLAKVSGFTIPGTAIFRDGYIFSAIKWVKTDSGLDGRDYVESKGCVMGGCWVGRYDGNRIKEDAELSYIAIIMSPDGNVGESDRLREEE